jgi:hypothetical protein
MKAVCRYCAGGVGGGGVARGDHQHRHHQRGQVPGPSGWEETRFKTRALFSKKVGARQGDGGSLCQYAIRRGPMMVATGGALIRTDIEKDDLRLAAERACLFVPCGGQLVKDGKPTDVLYT